MSSCQIGQGVPQAHGRDTQLNRADIPKLSINKGWNNVSFLFDMIASCKISSTLTLNEWKKGWQDMLEVTDEDRLIGLIRTVMEENIKIYANILTMFERHGIIFLAFGHVYIIGTESIQAHWEYKISLERNSVTGLNRLLEILMILQLQLEEAVSDLENVLTYIRLMSSEEKMEQTKTTTIDCHIVNSSRLDMEDKLKRYAQINRETSVSQNTIAKLESDKNVLQKNVQSIFRSKQDLEDKLKRETSVSQDTIAKLESDKNVLQKNIQILERSKQDLEDKLKRSKEEQEETMKSNKEHIDTLNAEMSKREEALALFKSKIDELETILREKTRETSVSQNTIAKLESDKNVLQKNVQSIFRSKQDLEDKLKRETSVSQDTMAKLESDKNVLQKNIQILERSKQDLEDKLKRSKDEQEETMKSNKEHIDTLNAEMSKSISGEKIPKMNSKRRPRIRQASEAAVQNIIETVLSYVEHPRTMLLHDAYIEYHSLMKCKLLMLQTLKPFQNPLIQDKTKYNPIIQDETRYKCRPLYKSLESVKDDTNECKWAWSEYKQLLVFQEEYQKYETKESQSFYDERITPVLEKLSSIKQYDITLANIELAQLLKKEDQLKQMYPDDYKAYKATSEDLRQHNTNLEKALLKAVICGIDASEGMDRYLYLKMYERAYEDLQKEQHGQNYKINPIGAIKNLSKTSSARPGEMTEAKHEPPPDYPGTVKDGYLGEDSGETISSKSSEEKETDTIDITKNEKYQNLLHEICLKEVKIEELKDRLSNVAGNKLTDGNPNIADLSDENRPTKIDEMFGTTYGDEWTDAFEAMKESKTTDEDAIIRGLQLIVKRSFEVCQSTAKSQIQRLQHTSEKIMLDPLGEGQKDTTKKTKISYEKKQILLLGVKHLKDYRKITASASTTELCEYFRSSVMTDITKQLKWKKKNIPEHVLRYANRCVKVTWLMSVQDPPMYLHWAKEKDVVNSDLFKCYEKMGQNVEFTVWPALSLYEGGALISKGCVKTK